jgi:hypothetical protein
MVMVADAWLCLTSFKFLGLPQGCMTSRTTHIVQLIKALSPVVNRQALPGLGGGIFR